MVMKIAITSDIHLEFGDWYPSNPEGAETLILSGDIMVAHDMVEGSLRGEMYRQFLDNCKKEYKHVLYVMGNHEHYHGDFAKTDKILRNVCEDYGVHLLDRGLASLGGITFIGGTLWTDMNKEDELTISHIRSMMNDFRCVKNTNAVPVTYKTWVDKTKPVGMTDEEWIALPYEKRSETVFKTRPATFSPENAVEEHRKMVGYIRNVVDMHKDRKYVVIGHHAPSKQSTHPRYKNEELMNGAYSSDLTEFILNRPQIKLWTHGHTHEQFDYMVGSTRIVCNPRGYVNYERGPDKIEPYLAKVVEV